MNKQKIFESLYFGGRITTFTPGRYTVMNSAKQPVARINGTVFKQLNECCIKVKKNGLVYWLMQKKEIRKINGNNWIKKEWKKLRAWLTRKCEPCSGLEIITLKNTQ